MAHFDSWISCTSLQLLLISSKCVFDAENQKLFDKSQQSSTAAGKNKARILKEGALTLITYGANDSIMWLKRIGSFQCAVRCALLTSCPVPGMLECTAFLRTASILAACCEADSVLNRQTSDKRSLLYYRGVLGNRKPGQSPWGGSVLDSVVGAFLTQNVRHLFHDALLNPCHAVANLLWQSAHSIPAPLQASNDIHRRWK